MSLPVQLNKIFRNKQASYKMVLMLAVLERADEQGKSHFQDVIQAFYAYYDQRKRQGKIVEKPDKEVIHLDRFSDHKKRSLITKNPLEALSSVLTLETDHQGVEYVRFQQDIWEQLTRDDLQELKVYAQKELDDYYSKIESPFSILESFRKVMHEYLQARSEPFKGHPLGNFVRQEIKQGMYQLSFISTERYKIHASVGQGNWAKVPWIAIMDKNETDTTQHGVYVVYLFSEDMNKLYLCLQQGVTDPIRKYGRKKGHEHLQKAVEQLREVLPLQDMNQDQQLYLSDGGLGVDYQASTIAYFQYDKDQLPSDEQLTADLRNVINIYQHYLQMKKGNDEKDQYVEHEQVKARQEEGVPLDNRPFVRSTEANTTEILTYMKQYIAAKGFYYPDQFVENFYLSLKTKPFVLLAGISGTGKTKLVQLFAEALGATSENGQFKLIPVRPDWSDPSDLLGYVNIQEEFQIGPLASVIATALKPENREKPYIVCLDEMNLARVEHYFSDVLSIIETRRKNQQGDIVSDSLFSAQVNREKLGEVYKDLYVPSNVYIVGTVNMDETTYPFSKKVLDRANTIEFVDVQLDVLPSIQDEMRQGAEQDQKQFERTAYSHHFLQPKYVTLKDTYQDAEHQALLSMIATLNEINHILKQAHLHIGYRVRDEWLFYLLYNKQIGLLNEKVAEDFLILQKILPRIQGSSLGIRQVLTELFSYLANQPLTAYEAEVSEEMLQIMNEATHYERSLAKIAYMYRRFEEDGFTSYWLA